MNLILSSIAQGLLWAMLAMGVYVTIRILNVSDLSVEGTFPLGAAVAARFITEGQSPILGTLAAILAGMFFGSITGLMHKKLKIPALLAGIITMTGLYSINLVILGSANLSLLGEATMISQIQDFTGVSTTAATIILGLIATALVIAVLTWFFRTEYGMAIRATGDNEAMAEANGIDTDSTTIVGFMIANGLIALSGALLAQNNGYADVNMGTGAIVIGLASVIIGEVFFRNLALWKRLITVILGSIIYRLLLLIVLELNVNPQYLRFFSALILMLALSLPTVKEARKQRQKRKGGA